MTLPFVDVEVDVGVIVVVVVVDDCCRRWLFVDNEVY